MPPPINWTLRVALFLGVLFVTGSPLVGTSEFRTAQAVWVLLRTHEVRTTSVRPNLSELQSLRTELPSVLLLITESVRASDACQTLGCIRGPEFDRLLPERVTLQQARSLSRPETQQNLAANVFRRVLLSPPS